MNNLDRSLKLILAHEGGWSDHPADRGGATKYGITHGTLADARGTLEGLPESIRDLTKGQARLIYTHLYWRPSIADMLPWPVCYAQMDAAVQHGPGRAVTWLQRALPGLAADGKPGAKTRAAVEGVKDWTRPLSRMLIQRSLFYVRILRNADQSVFAGGWANRMRDVAYICDRDLPEANVRGHAKIDHERGSEPTTNQPIPEPAISLAQPKPILLPKHVTRLTEVADHIEAVAATSGRSRAEVFLAFLTKVVHIGHDAARTAGEIVSIWERINADHRTRR